MREEHIRQQTQAILDAYSEMAGGLPCPTIAEFLELRRQAEEELRRGLGQSVVSAAKVPIEDTTLKTIEPAAVRPPAARHTEEPPVRQPAPAVKARKPREAPITCMAMVPRVEEPEEKEDSQDTQEAAVSDFELLRNLADPWN